MRGPLQQLYIYINMMEHIERGDLLVQNCFQAIGEKNQQKIKQEFPAPSFITHSMISMNSVILN